MYSLRLFQDTIPQGVEVKPIICQHQIIYVYKGKIELNGQIVEEDSALYAQDSARITAIEDSIIWRFQLLRTSQPLDYAYGDGVVGSVLKMDRRVRMFDLQPRSQWLFRLDCIYDNVGSTGLHSHPGSGIRCLKSGELHVRGRVGEESDNVRPGDAWYEEGSYPIVSTSYVPDGQHEADPNNPSDFLRAMVLPVEYAEYPDTAMWIEGAKEVQSSWKSYSQQIVRLL